MKWLKKVAATPLTTIARVVDNLNVQTNDRTNAPSIHAVREAVNNNWLSIYPIGSIYLTVNPTFDPSVTFGGTWVQIKDRFLLASGDTYTSGAQDGSATNSYTPAGTVGNHTLTETEIPSHNHTYNKPSTGTVQIYEASQQYSSGTVSISTAAVTANQATGNKGGGAAHNHGFTGTATTLNNMPPYLVVNVWKRTS